ncbi:hypothetical protein B296_00037830 [Ensete ventricosum]|uniref:ABC transporter domain-containing protein n=1 Tax=Ensete ventricosum TaxID=4639 RepID=A0A426ZPN6_ENSVE|nr:hypothetical protein B296_00037830 [Ensete ventricosum]
MEPQPNRGTGDGRDSNLARVRRPVTLKVHDIFAAICRHPFDMPNQSLSCRMQFEDVVYKIKTKGKGKAKQGERVILKGVSGAVLPGEMLAMLGPSGSGKTTLLTVLGGRIGGTRLLTGSITYNGKPFTNSLKRRTGFVTQDDVLYPHLTVTETLVYTALLRLPSTLSRQEKTAQAEAVMVQLGLTACRSSIIGGPLVRGVSGGERKRVSIGQEMLIDPSLLFLDEPTSGLDSTIAGRIVSTLWDLTKGGKTVIMTIHQPSSRLFYMFHKVLLLSDGNSIYYGKGSDAMDYFASVGYAPTVPMNPADFLLDLANAIFTFPQERTMLTKERSSGMYRLSSYFAAKLVGDLPMELILPIIFVTITYWMGGLKPVAANFFMNLAVLLLGVLVAQGLGLALGALVMDLKTATTFASVLTLSFMLAGGYYVQNIPSFIAWIKYISPSYYTFKLQIATQYSPSDTYQCTPSIRCQIADFPSIKLVGFDHKAFAVLALLLMLFLYRLAAYLGLMRVGVTN